MSLSSHLANKNSPIRQFLTTRFSKTETFLRDARRKMWSANHIWPIRRGGYPYATLGTAIDYRLRYYFDVTPIENFVAYKGARDLTELQNIDQANYELGFHLANNDMYGRNVIIFDKRTGKQLYDYLSRGRPGGDGDGLSAFPAAYDLNYDYMQFWTTAPEFLSSGLDDGLPLKKDYREFFCCLERLLEELQPAGKDLTKDKEDELNRYCYVLALLEKIFRGGPSTGSPLLARDFRNLDELLSIPTPHCINDMCNLSWTFYDDFNHLLALPSNLNPNFEGSIDVGGADADLVVDGTLIEIKSTTKAKIEPKWLWQLMGYVLLDYSDSYQIQGIGLYMTRQGLLIRWSFEEVLDGLYEGRSTNMEQLRDEFQELLRSLQTRILTAGSFPESKTD